MIRHPLLASAGVVAALFLAGCQSIPRPDFTNFRAHQPRSILVLPPLNQSTDLLASPSVLTTLTRPLCERGYYVFPVAMVDAYMREQGLPGPGEMHQVPPAKLREVFGADAVLYVTVEKYNQTYLVLAATSNVHLHGRLVDTATGLLLWEGWVRLSQKTSGLIEPTITLVANKVSDHLHDISALASFQLVCVPIGNLQWPIGDPLSAMLIGHRHATYRPWPEKALAR